MPFFGPASTERPANLGYDGDSYGRMPFSPVRPGSADAVHARLRRLAGPSRPTRKIPTSPRVGKVTHPSGAPDNHLLTVWSPATPVERGKHTAS